MAKAETKFTPGPWALCYDGQIDGPSGQTVCRFQWSSFKEFNDDEEWKATARLITTAPDLYAFVVEFLEWHEGPGRTDSPLAEDARRLLSRVEQPQ